MQETDLRTSPLERHIEGLQRQMPVVDRADRPPDDEPREQIENRGQIKLPILPDNKLGRVGVSVASIKRWRRVQA
jgi:hypothetical protein